MPKLECFTWDKHTKFDKVEKLHDDHVNNLLVSQLESMPNLQSFQFGVPKVLPCAYHDNDTMYLSSSCDFEAFSFSLNTILEKDNCNSSDPPLATEYAFEVPLCDSEAYLMWIPYGRKINVEFSFHHISNVYALMYAYYDVSIIAANW